MVESKTKKNDFIEIEFIAINLTNNEVFDTNITEEAKKIDLKLSGKPLIICIGKNMVVKGLDEALEEKEPGKKYSIKLTPDKAFGQRYPHLVKMMPLKVFAAQKVYPQPGMTFALDNNLVKIISVSGGRVMVDFNNPLAGKDIEYDFTIKRFVESSKERLSALQLFLFGQEFEADINEESKKIIFKDVKLTPILDAFKNQFKDILGMDIEIFAKKESNLKEIEASKNLGALGKEEKKEEVKATHEKK